MLLPPRCLQCEHLEEAHDEAMENYIRIVEQQGLLFRQRQTVAARDLDIEIRRLKALRQAVVDELLQHQSGGHERLKA